MGYWFRDVCAGRSAVMGARFGDICAGRCVVMKRPRQKNAAAGMVFMIMFLVSAVLSVIYPGMFGAIGDAEVSAAGTAPEFTGWVQDDASLLSSEEEDALEKECARVSEVHGMGVYIVTTQDFGGGDIKNWQRQIFTEYGLGADCADSGVMLAISMAARDWGLVGFGEAQGAFTTYGRERMGELILDDLSDGEFYDAFARYVFMADDYLTAYEEGKPYTEDHHYGEGWRIPLIIGVSFLLSLAVSLVIVLTWKKSMNTRVRRDGALEYMREGSFQLSNRTDRFLYHTVSRTKRQKESSSGSGSGGMHSDHSGTSGKF
ncbi:TPM domain-containing protein [Lachnospiraceae bacterium 56-18]